MSADREQQPDWMRASKKGISAEAHNKVLSKFDAETASALLAWIEETTKEPLENNSGEIENFVVQLKDGLVLCSLANALKPGVVPKVNKSKMAFKQMENVTFFLNFLEKDCEVPKNDLFQVVDLYENQDPNSVLIALCSLARKTERLFSVAGYGPKESTGNKREWTEEQLRAGDGIIGTQAGYNKGASAAGTTPMGQTRHM